MQTSESGASADLEARKQRIAARFEIGGELASVQQVAQVLGLRAKSIARQIRAKTFPIAHRRIGRAVLFDMGDVVRWLEEKPSEATLGPVAAASEPNGGNARSLPLNLVEAIVRHAAISADETPAQRAERISQKILAKMANARRR